MAINDNRARIQFRRGTGLKLTGVTNEEKVAYGQPIYNVTKNYLTIGDSTSGGKLYKNLQPINVRRVKGYFDDAVTMSGVANEDRSYDILGGTNGKLQIKSSGSLELWASDKAFNSGSTAPTLPSISIVNSGLNSNLVTVNGDVDTLELYTEGIYDRSARTMNIGLSGTSSTFYKSVDFVAAAYMKNTLEVDGKMTFYDEIRNDRFTPTIQLISSTSTIKTINLEVTNINLITGV